MKLRLPLLLRLALLSTAAAYTLGSGCLFADDAPADAAQDDPIAEAVEDDDAALMPTIGFEGYTESQLVDIQSSDAVGAVIHGVLENSTTGAVANVGTTSSTSNGAPPAAESPALTLSAPSEPATDSALTTSTLSDSAGEGAVAPFFSAEEAAALVVASPATSTPLIKNASTATLTSSDASDETTSSAVANGAVSSSIASVGSVSAGGAGASSGGGSASYSLTSSSSDSSSSSLVTTTTTDDTSSDPIAEEVLEDSTTETTTTSTTLPDSSASTLATTTSSSTTTTRTLPPLKLLGAAGNSVTVSKGNDNASLGGTNSDAFVKYGVEFITNGDLDNDNKSGDKSILYFHGDSNNGSFDSMTLTGKQFWLRQAGKDTAVNFKIGSMTLNTDAAEVTFSSNPWEGNKFYITVSTLAVSGSATLKVDQSSKEKAVSVTIDSVSGGSLSEVTNSGVLTLGTAATEVEAASTISTGSITNSGTLNLYGKLIAGNVALNGATLTIGEGATLSTSSMDISGVTTIDNSANNSVYTQTAVSLADGTSLTLWNTNLTASSSTDRTSGSLTVRGNGTLTLTSKLKDLTIEGGIVVTSTTGEVAPISGTVTVKAGGTYKVGGHDGLGWSNGNSTSSIVLEGTGNEASQRAVLDLANARSTANPILNLKGYATVQNGTWDPYGANSGQQGGTIVVSGTGNVIASDVNIRLRDSGGAVFDVSLNSDVEMGGKFTLDEYGYGDDKTIVKKGDGLLTVTGESSIGNAVFVYAGTLKLAGAAGKVGSGAITLSSNAVLELAHTAECPLSGNISSAEGATGTTLRVSGSGEETLRGTVNVSVTDIQSGTLNLSGSSASLGAVTVGAGGGLSATGSSQTLNLSSVVVNEGTLNLRGVTALSFTGDAFGDNFYSDTKAGADFGNGFIGGYWLIRNQDRGTISNLNLDALTVSVNGTEQNVSSSTNGLYLTSSATEGQSHIYFVNTGNVSYNASTNSSGCSVVTQLCLQGGTLVLDSTDIKSGVGVQVKQDSTVNIGTNRTLTDSQVASVENGATLTLTGSGTYSLAVGQIGETASLTSGVALASGESGFTGTVLLNKGTTLNGTDLSALTNGSYSSVTMTGVTGTLKSGVISTNLVLKDYKKDSVEQSALAISGGTEKITFSGGISGGGKVEITPVEGTPADITFSGDIREWTGGIAGGTGTVNLTFTGGATEIHAAVSKATISDDIILNVFIDASKDRTFTRGISANSLKLIGGDTVKTVSVKGDSVQYLGSVDLKDENVILQVSGTGTTFLYAYDAELAVGGSSGIDIADNSGKALTTLRTNTQDASSSGGATLSYCMFSYNNSNGRAVITGYNTVIDRAVIDVVNGSTLELNDVVLSASTWLHDEETTGDVGSTSTYTGSVILNGVEGKVTGTGEDGGTLQTGTVLTQTGTTGSGEGTKLTLQSDAKVFKIAYSQINQMASIGGNGLTLDFDTYDDGKGFASLYETLNGKYDYVAIEFDSTVGEINFSTLVVNAKITNGDRVTGTTTGYYVGGTNGVVNSNGTSGVVVYFDAIALPEPTTSTLGLLALAALCARRRRSRTRAHAEHA